MYTSQVEIAFQFSLWRDNVWLLQRLMLPLSLAPFRYLKNPKPGILASWRSVRVQILVHVYERQRVFILNLVRSRLAEFLESDLVLGLQSDLVKVEHLEEGANLDEALLALIELEEQLFEFSLDSIRHLYVMNQLLAGTLVVQLLEE